MNFKPIFNKLTSESFDKFVEINNFEIRRKNIKSEYEEQLLKYFNENELSLERFKEFYKETEVAGKKHFYLYKIEYSDEVLDVINKWCSKHEDEIDREFDPDSDNEKIYYKKNEDKIIIKRFKIKKIFKHIGDTESNEQLMRVYEIINIHYVEFIEFDLIKNKVIFGFDSYGDYVKKEKLKEKINELLQSILLKHYYNMESLIDSDHIDKMRFLSNCLVYSLSNRATRLDSAVFKKEKANIERILSDLRYRKYKIDEIKENNPDYDIQTHLLLEASIEKSIDNDFYLLSDKADFYYFTEKSGIISKFRFRIDTIESQIVTFSSSITRMELWDVFNRIS